MILSYSPSLHEAVICLSPYLIQIAFCHVLLKKPRSRTLFMHVNGSFHNILLRLLLIYVIKLCKFNFILKVIL